MQTYPISQLLNIVTAEFIVVVKNMIECWTSSTNPRNSNKNESKI